MSSRDCSETTVSTPWQTATGPASERTQISVAGGRRIHPDPIGDEADPASRHATVGNWSVLAVDTRDEAWFQRTIARSSGRVRPRFGRTREVLVRCDERTSDRRQVRSDSHRRDDSCARRQADGWRGARVLTRKWSLGRQMTEHPLILN